jgi:hypothetical protein
MQYSKRLPQGDVCTTGQDMRADQIHTKLRLDLSTADEPLMRVGRVDIAEDLGDPLRPYKASYLQQAGEVRDTVSFAYQLNYLNLAGSYLTAASQLNLAAGREVLQ